ncbi:MAG: YihY/virulence factor BrkB family protein [Sumerlaeia bacterium]
MKNFFTLENLAHAKDRVLRLGSHIQTEKLDSLPGSRKYQLFLAIPRFLLVLWREINKDQMFQRAASLTYTTILSIFPLLAFVTGVGAAFYGNEQEDQFIDWLEQRLLPPTTPVMLNDGLPIHTSDSDREEFFTLAETVRAASKTYREKATGLGFVGFMGVLLAAAFLYRSIEDGFEASWQTGHKQNFSRTVTGFTLFVFFIILFAGVSISVSTYAVSLFSDGDPGEAVEDLAESPARSLLPVPESVMRSAVSDITSLDRMTSGVLRPTTDTLTDNIAPAPPTPMAEPPSDRPPGYPGYPNGTGEDVSGIAGLLLGFITPLFNALALALAYMLIPPTNVKLKYALMGGLAAGFLWEGAKVGFFYYVMLSSTNQELIKSLGAVPIFLIWIYFTWVVFLLGNEITYVAQNSKRLFRQYFLTGAYCPLDCRLLLGVAMIVGDAFDEGRGGINAVDIVHRLGARYREVEDVLGTLKDNHVVMINADGQFTLARPAHRISLESILDLGSRPAAVLGSDARYSEGSSVAKAMAQVNEYILGLGKGTTLADALAGKNLRGPGLAIPPDHPPATLNP